MFKAREYHQKHCTECALDKPPCYQLVETREWIDLKKRIFFFFADNNRTILQNAAELLLLLKFFAFTSSRKFIDIYKKRRL